jgi:hypothetical protein
MNIVDDLSFSAGAFGRRAQQHQTIDLTWLGGNRCITGGSAPHAAPDHRYRLRSGLSHIAHGG